MSNSVRCFSPIDGSLYAEREILARADIGRILEDARTAQRAWAKRPIAERAALARAGIEALGAMKSEVVPELAWMMGRPVRYGGEQGGVVERVSHMAAIAERALAPLVVEESDRFRRKILRVPHGVVFVAAPWNYPYLTAVNAVAPALIAGNAVLLKPASQTLLTGERFEKAFLEAGLPEGLMRCVFLDHPSTEALLGEGAFDYVSFTGSVEAGAVFEKAAAGRFTGLGLELGGKDPAYVAADADLDAAVATVIDGAMFNAGQCCCGIERIYVDKRRYRAFVEKAVEEIERLRLGNPLDEATSLGPMAHRRFAKLVRDQTDAAIAAGARRTVDRAKFPADDGGAYLAPELLVDVDHRMRVMREESFGPVVGVMPVEDDAAAIRFMNDSAFGLTASIWTSDPERAEAIAADVDAGTIYMNRCDYLDPGLCWTGVKASGRGGALSEIGYHQLTRPKSHHFRLMS